MNLAPIILFVYNRPEHTKKTVDALRLNNLASESLLFIFSDGNKNENDRKAVEEVRNYIATISGFKDVKITLRKKNLGLADSVISGVTEVIEKFGKAIVLEDDIVTSPYFLKFMNEALDFYEKDKRIYSISGYNFPIKIPEEYQHKIYISPRPSSWGWATWKDRWRKAVWNPEKVFDIKNHKLLNQYLDKSGKDISPMLLKTFEKKINSWAVRWVFTHIYYQAYSLFPVKSLTKNIGADATGTNFIRSTNKYNVELETDFKQFDFSKDLKLNKDIIEQIKRIVKPGIISYLKYRLFNLY